MKIPRKNVYLETITPMPGSSFVCREFRFGGHFPFNWHYHPELELTMILKGRGLRFVGDSVRDYRDGDVCFLGANLPHTWYSKPAKGAQAAAIVIQFLPEMFGDHLLNLPEGQALQELFNRARRGLVVTGKARQAIAEQMIAMRKIRPGSLQYLCRLLNMLNLLSESSECKTLAVSDFRPVLNKQASKTINAVCGMINENISEIPTQAEAAALARLSPQAFSRFFRRCVGMTYVEYVNELRIGMACRALLETDKSITAIAYDTGFNNLSNFNRRFRAIKQMTPRKYRSLTHVD
jgi:AraC-like DNA-binding protein/quercetin dioxygenase-like cupin family protein